MTHDDIQKEWDLFIEYPEGSDKLYVTTTSALLFARVIAEMAATAEREACVTACFEQTSRWEDVRARYAASECAAAIRTRDLS